jgi:hypothetical protein
MGIPCAGVHLPRSLVEPQLELRFRHGRVEALGGNKNPRFEPEEFSGVGRYGIHLDGLEKHGLRAVREALHTKADSC